MQSTDARTRGIVLALAAVAALGLVVGAAAPAAAQSGGTDGGDGSWFGGFEWDFGDWFNDWLCHLFGTCDDPAVDDLRIEVESSTLTAGESTDVTVTALYDDGSAEIVTDDATLTSSDQSVATVDGATVTAVGVGSTTLSVTYEDFTGVTTVTVEPPAEPTDFQVTDVTSNAPVTEGETLTVEATLRNRGGFGTQNVSLTLGPPYVVEPQPLPGVNGTGDNVTLQDDGSLETVTVENDTVDETVIEAPVRNGSDEVIIGPVVPPLDDPDNQSRGLSGKQLARNVTLGANESRTLTFDVLTDLGDTGDYAARVTTDNDTAATTATVDPDPDSPPYFDVQYVWATGGTAGENVSVDVSVANHGGAATQTVAVDAGDLGTIAADLPLEAGEHRWLSPVFETDATDAGTHDVEARSEDDSRSTTVTLDPPLTPPPDVRVTGVVTNAPVTRGDTLVVDATLENRGGAGVETVALDVGDLGLATQDVQLASNETTTVSFSLPIEPGDEGTYTATVSTSTDEGSTTVSVVTAPPPGVLAVTDVSMNSPVVAGETITVTATVEKTDSFGTRQNVTLDAGMLGSRTKTVEVGPFGNETVTFTLPTNTADIGRYAATVATEDDSASVELVVEDLTDRFTATVEDGYLEIGTRDRRVDFPECEDGTAPNTSVDCIRFSGSYSASAGTVTAQPDQFHFPDMRFETDGPRDVVARINATEPITGRYDPDAGNASLAMNLTLTARNYGLLDRCDVGFSLSATTGRSGNVTGTVGPRTTVGTTDPTVVDGRFEIPSASPLLNSCDGFDSVVGLPAGPGENELVMDLHVEFEQDIVPVPTSG